MVGYPISLWAANLASVSRRASILLAREPSDTANGIEGSFQNNQLINLDTPRHTPRVWVTATGVSLSNKHANLTGGLMSRVGLTIPTRDRHHLSSSMALNSSRPVGSDPNPCGVTFHHHHDSKLRPREQTALSSFARYAVDFDSDEPGSYLGNPLLTLVNYGPFTDGGGVRGKLRDSWPDIFARIRNSNWDYVGLSQLIMLDEIMHQLEGCLNSREHIAPSSVFHLIGGTSTGG